MIGITKISDFIHRVFAEATIVKLAPLGRSEGCVVISYITWPFQEGLDSPKMRGHTNAFEVIAMAESFLELGYRVEICNYDDIHYKLPADCILAIDIHGNLERWHGESKSPCHFILHATGTHWLQLNNSELGRLESLRDRKGIALQPRRQAAVSNSVEFADRIVVLGNEFTVKSWEFSGKPIVRIPISSAYDFEWPQSRDFSTAKRKFLWIGSYGMVHKGLDLVLEAFSGMPHLELTVCGRPEKEDDFFRLYEAELRRVPNIHFCGWMDMGTQAFSEIAATHAAVIYPSCAEGGAGSVIHCMHAGMIPACTYEASVDLGNFGELVQSGTVDAVQETCRKIAALSDEEVESRARASYDHARANHTRKKFRENYQTFAAVVIAGLK